MSDSLTIRSLNLEDAPQLSAMLRAQSRDYARFFTPFSFDEETISGILDKRERDVFMGMYWRNRLVGFFMLRGWDEGYEVAAYGVLTDQAYRGYGLARLSLEMAKIICRLCRTPRMMLKVHPRNIVAKTLFEKARFVLDGADDRGNLVYYFEINERSGKS